LPFRVSTGPNMPRERAYRAGRGCKRVRGSLTKARLRYRCRFLSTRKRQQQHRSSGNNRKPQPALHGSVVLSFILYYMYVYVVVSGYGFLSDQVAHAYVMYTYSLWLQNKRTTAVVRSCVVDTMPPDWTDHLARLK
jgi:hypothetical protein